MLAPFQAPAVSTSKQRHKFEVEPFEMAFGRVEGVKIIENLAIFILRMNGFGKIKAELEIRENRELPFVENKTKSYFNYLFKTK